MSPKIWATIKSLGIQGKEPTYRGFRGGRTQNRHRPDVHHDDDTQVLESPNHVPNVNVDMPADLSNARTGLHLPNFKADDEKFECFKSRGLHFIHLNTQ